MDRTLYRAVNRFAGRTGWLHPPIVAFAKYGIVLFGIALLAGWWLGRQRSDITTVAAVVCAVAAVFVALGVAQLIGHVIGRARPYDAIAGMRLLVSRTNDFSFPSDHATVAGAVAGGLWAVDRRLARAAVIAAIAMAFSRVYVGAHYPGDVIVGVVLGAAVAVGVNRVVGAQVGRWLGFLVRSPLGPLIARGAGP